MLRQQQMIPLHPYHLLGLIGASILFIYPERLEAWTQTLRRHGPIGALPRTLPKHLGHNNARTSPPNSLESRSSWCAQYRSILHRGSAITSMSTSPNDSDDDGGDTTTDTDTDTTNTTDQLPPPTLPSSYDTTYLPASIRGEAVRQAIRSQRGICLDFTSPLYPQMNVGVVGVTGEGTLNFLNSKLTNSFGTETLQSGDAAGAEGVEEHGGGGVRVERGTVTEAGLLESRGRMIDRLVVVTFPASGGTAAGAGVEASMITSPGHAGSALFERLDPFIFPLDGVKLVDLFPTVAAVPGTGTAADTSNKVGRGKRRRGKAATKASVVRDTKVFTIAAAKREDAQTAVRNDVLPLVAEQMKNASAESDFSSLLPSNRRECVRYTHTSTVGDGVDEEVRVTILEHTFLPTCVCHGYTFVITSTITTTTASHTDTADADNDDDTDTQPATPIPTTATSRIWQKLTSYDDDDDDNPSGPVELGSLEYETLRIEGGQPAYGYEISCDETKKRNKRKPKQPSNDDDDTNNGIAKTNATPFELHLDSLVDPTKGCYVGQEGIATQLKNKMGVPRKLYSVVFRDDDNLYNGDDDDDDDDDSEFNNNNNNSDQQQPLLLDNKTFRPKPGDELYVLGSNEQIRVGTLTSVAESGATSSPETVALAMVRREASILKKMKKMDLEIEMDNGGGGDFLFKDGDMDGSSAAATAAATVGSGMVSPPPIDPLDGLEVVIGGTFTQGRLRVVASRKLRQGLNLFEVGAWDSSSLDVYQETGTVMGFIDQTTEEDQDPTASSQTTLDVHVRDDPTAFDDDAVVDQSTENDDDDDNHQDVVSDLELQKAVEAATQAAEEAKCKAEKLAKLQRRTEEAMAARKQKKEEAKRKAEKLAELQRRTEEAMVARKQKKEEVRAQKEKEEAAARAKDSGSESDRIEAERRRKAEKMEELQKKMEEALDRRKNKKKSGL